MRAARKDAPTRRERLAVGKPARGILRNESGSLVLETALALLVIVPMVLWLFEMCMLTYTYSVLGDAARQGVRYAIVHGTDNTNCSGPSSGCSDSTGGNVVSVVDTAAAYCFHNISGMTVQVSYPDASSAPPSRVGVAIQYTYVPYFKLPGIATVLQLSAQGRIIY
ncbi:MAG: TadE/TadG family type IV pilus assembly protein [Acidobacteriaceae bacterium]